MLLLFLSSCLLLYITYNIGSISLKGLSAFLGITVQANSMETFLAGLMASAVYFNLLSFFTAVNFVSLIPLFLISMLYSLQTKQFPLLYSTISNFISLLKHNVQGWAFFAFSIVFIVYWIIPPMNWDSIGYHYSSIYWYEQEQVIPGLGNIHGRLAFNPVCFIISAAYAFSDLVGQPLYPLNGVLVAFFYTWLIRIILTTKNATAIVYLLIGIFLYRPLLANISSPSSEPLALVGVSVICIRFINSIQAEEKSLSHYLLSILLTVFIAAAKISSAPLMLMIPLLFFYFIRPYLSPAIMLKLLLPVGLILVPWLMRNVVLSGYLVYPLLPTRLDFLDWTIPKDVALLDYTFSHNGPRIFMGTISDAINKPFTQWFPVWVQQQFIKHKWYDLLIVVLAFASPFYWIFSVKNKQRVSFFMVWLVVFACVVIWLIGAPEHRFGMAFLVFAFAIPFVQIMQNKFLPAIWLNGIVVLLFSVATIYYSYRAFNDNDRNYSFTLSDMWLKPLPDKNYFNNKPASAFRSKQLNNEVTLYYANPGYECTINTNPCMVWYYGNVVLRGKTLQEGFKNIDCRVREVFTFLNEIH